MRKYLDPVYLAVTEEAWRSRTYWEIFSSLKRLFDRIKEIEEKTDSRNKLVKLKCSLDLLKEIYNNNPWKNEPKVGKNYEKRFKEIFGQLGK